MIARAAGWLVAACCAAAPLAAQSPADRAALSALQDSLSNADAGKVQSFSDEWSPDRGKAMTELRRGLIELRRGELTDDRGSFDDALMHLSEAAFREENWPWVWYAMAITKAAMTRREFTPKPNAHQPIGMSYYTGFERAIARSLQLDRRFKPAVDFVIAALIEEGQREQPDELLAPLHLIANDSAPDPRVLLILARAARTAHQPDSALAFFRRYQAGGGDPGTAALELARALRAVDRTEQAVAEYWAGLARPTERGRAMYRADFAWIASPRELAQFDSLPNDSLTAWAHRFWTLRDAESLREPGARLPEHLRRWNYVFAHFRVENPERKTQFARVSWPPIGPCIDPGENNFDDFEYDDPARTDDLRREERLLDQRAILYMRHGEPDVRFRTLATTDSLVILPPDTGSLSPSSSDEDAAASGAASSGNDDDLAGQVTRAFQPAPGSVISCGGITPLEYWIYWFAGRTRIYQFGPNEALGCQAPTTVSAEPVESYSVLRSLARYDARYIKVAHRVLLSQGANIGSAVPLQCAPPLRAIRRDRQQDLAVSVQTDSYTLLFDHLAPAIVQTFAVGRPEQGDSRLLVEFAVAGDSLSPTAPPDGGRGVAYQLRFRITAVDTVQGIVRRLDTTRTYVTRDTLGAGTTLNGYLELPVPAGHYVVRAAIFQPDRGVSVERPAMAFTPAAGALALSDLVLGRRGSGLTWPNGRGDRVPLNPLNVFRPGGELQLYYELGGLNPGGQYRTTVGLRREKDKDEHRGLKLVFTETATARDESFQRSIDLSRLKPGRYELMVTIDEVGSDRTITRERTVVIQQP